MHGKRGRKEAQAHLFSVFSVVISVKQVFSCLAAFSMGIVFKSVHNLGVDYSFWVFD